MKQKIVMHVPMHSDKAKSKAMKIAVAIPGVTSVNIGAENDRLEVTGEGVDSVCLANSLRKKFCFADIISVNDVKPPVKPVKPVSPPWKPTPFPYCPSVYYECRPVYDSPPNCSIF
ncbi:heavy metal-associated isoprenylated plant protein 12-like [Salvia miltiorrhiza]|uniref:heavy metal-associated isoprenylated plant protein 12-like n=1 Tax=Salvia miltiorrhiza TaxID=226208 RepID=UPI0025ABBE69|nr:heavy metal-associated isoprenylated plant protein 12-like [Salvia miltiorrhiza]